MLTSFVITVIFQVISAPDGWDFLPNEVIVDVDGKSDICSLGQDINFEFIGYKLKGKILNRDDPDAISGALKVKIELVDVAGNVLDTAISQNTDGGKYSFSGVKTGKYVVRVSDESLQTYSFQENKQIGVIFYVPSIAGERRVDFVLAKPGES